MKIKLFKVLSQCAKVLQCIFIFCSFIMVLGTILVIAFRDRIVGMLKSENYLMVGYDKFYLPFIIATCISALIILICIVLICRYFQKIMDNLSREQYFVDVNSKYCIKTLITISILTGCQLLSRIFFIYSNAHNVSYLFEFSLKDYFLNIVFLVMYYVGYILFKNGKNLKDDLESII